MKNKGVIFAGVAIGAAVIGFLVVKRFMGAQTGGGTGQTIDPLKGTLANDMAAATPGATPTPATSTTTPATPSTSTGNAANDAIENPTTPAAPETFNGYLVSAVRAAGETEYEAYLKKISAKTGKKITKKQESKFWTRYFKTYAKTNTPDVTTAA